MRPSVTEEATYYDSIYALHLAAPEHALAVSLAQFQKDLCDPRKAVFERRLLYSALLERLLATQPHGKCILDYGCGTGEWGVLAATLGAYVCLVDISQVAIQVALKRARASHVLHRVLGIVQDASQLSCLRDESFDVIIAVAALHHTLKYPGAITELARVLRTGGVVLAAETLGNNPLLNTGRTILRTISRQPPEAGEGIIFSDRELSLLERHFQSVEVQPMNLFAMLKRIFRNRFHYPGVVQLLKKLEAVDSWLLATWPSLRRSCGEVLIVCRK